MKAVTHATPMMWKDISRTRLFVTIQGVLFGLIGMTHGLYEIMQGNVPTGGYLLDKIGAFTVIHNFLLTGIAAVCVGLLIAVWTVAFLPGKYGPLVFLFLALLLFLVGGGFAPMLFFVITFLVSTRLGKPLNGWQRISSPAFRERLAGLWPGFFIAGYLFLLTGIAIWLILTPPGTIFEEHQTNYFICWAALIIGLILQMLTIVSGFSFDIERMGHA